MTEGRCGGSGCSRRLKSRKELARGRCDRCEELGQALRRSQRPLRAPSVRPEPPEVRQRAYDDPGASPAWRKP